jgi:predicted CopG family antitoxin
MARKTIRLDLEAYERLKAAKKPGEPFGAAIKRLVPPLVNLEEWLAELDRSPLDGWSSSPRSRS